MGETEREREGTRKNCHDIVFNKQYKRQHICTYHIDHIAAHMKYSIIKTEIDIP